MPLFPSKKFDPAGSDGGFLRFFRWPNYWEANVFGPQNLRWFLMWWYHFQRACQLVHDVIYMCTWLHEHDYKIWQSWLFFCQSICVFFMKHEDFDAWVLLLKPGRSQHRAQPAIFRPEIGLLENKKCHVEISVGFFVITPLRLVFNDRWAYHDIYIYKYIVSLYIIKYYHTYSLAIIHNLSSNLSLSYTHNFIRWFILVVTFSVHTSFHPHVRMTPGATTHFPKRYGMSLMMVPQVSSLTELLLGWTFPDIQQKDV